MKRRRRFSALKDFKRDIGNVLNKPSQLWKMGTIPRWGAENTNDFNASRDSKFSFTKGNLVLGAAYEYLIIPQDHKLGLAPLVLGSNFLSSMIRN